MENRDEEQEQNLVMDDFLVQRTLCWMPLYNRLTSLQMLELVELNLATADEISLWSQDVLPEPRYSQIEYLAILLTLDVPTSPRM